MEREVPARMRKFGSPREQLSTRGYFFVCYLGDAPDSVLTAASLARLDPHGCGQFRRGGPNSGGRRESALGAQQPAGATDTPLKAETVICRPVRNASDGVDLSSYTSWHPDQVNRRGLPWQGRRDTRSRPFVFGGLC